jgi:cell division topological specificity factor
LPNLQQEILDVIRKYVDVDLSAVSVNYEQEETHEVLEFNIILPEMRTQGFEDGAMGRPAPGAQS